MELCCGEILVNKWLLLCFQRRLVFELNTTAIMSRVYRDELSNREAGKQQVVRSPAGRYTGKSSRAAAQPSLAVDRRNSTWEFVGSGTMAKNSNPRDESFLVLDIFTIVHERAHHPSCIMCMILLDSEMRVML